MFSIGCGRAFRVVLMLSGQFRGVRGEGARHCNIQCHRFIPAYQPLVRGRRASSGGRLAQNGNYPVPVSHLQERVFKRAQILLPVPQAGTVLMVLRKHTSDTGGSLLGCAKVLPEQQRRCRLHVNMQGVHLRTQVENRLAHHEPEWLDVEERRKGCIKVSTHRGFVSHDRIPREGNSSSPVVKLWPDFSRGGGLGRQNLDKAFRHAPARPPA